MNYQPFKWFGGKAYLLDDILPFPTHRTYIDVFGGSGVVLLNKVPAPREVYNDINGRLVNAFRCIQNRWMELVFLSDYKGAINARELFERYKEESPDPLEDAFRFFYINRHSYSGKNDTFAGLHTYSKMQHNSYLNAIHQLPTLKERLKNVIIESSDFRRMFERFDAPDTLFYVDPPYYKGGDQYEKGIGGEPWTEEDLEDLYEILGGIEGKFILSIDKKVIGVGWRSRPIERINRASEKERKVEIEYVIRNFDPKRSRHQTPSTQKTLF
jgi:DNA adenine methylase